MSQEISRSENFGRFDVTFENPNSEEILAAKGIQACMCRQALPLKVKLYLYEIGTIKIVIKHLGFRRMAD
ncbi:hypothetical protein LZF95_01660 [Algoriphagus sp. AGSA1]|uniref:hypothetical protein n=1 Tax=Algoriphagus sp. AGSA1 TaxID=2907213 RepID=UPI001F44C684|nr:hypothetical protein [Algoriphagus sp. AGSA1]MCE7053364.1 hypothetical protein [Algoriphagus sp. AGSA1]